VALFNQLVRGEFAQSAQLLVIVLRVDKQVDVIDKGDKGSSCAVFSFELSAFVNGRRLTSESSVDC
jgi:uncharacterized protein YuzB (UPF0349 family)